MTRHAATPGQSKHSAAHRLELLLFRLDNQQLFGINVLKVKEIIACPHLTQIPQASPVVRGVAELRGRAIPIIDLTMAIGRQGIEQHTDLSRYKVIIAEFNRHTRGFLVSAVERIIVKQWQDILPPPRGAGNSYITGVIRQDDALIQILDVERILGESSPGSAETVSSAHIEPELKARLGNRLVLVVDDSAIARTQTTRTLDDIGIPYFVARDGRQALDIIEATAADCATLSERIPLVLSDIEMPEMDGYQLTREIRSNPHCGGVYVLLHTSLDGEVNAELARQAGANKTLTKFVPELLADEVLNGLRTVLAH